MAGGFELNALPVFHEGIPKGFEYQLLPENWDHFSEYNGKKTIKGTKVWKWNLFSIVHFLRAWGKENSPVRIPALQILSAL